MSGALPPQVMFLKGSMFSRERPSQECMLHSRASTVSQEYFSKCFTRMNLLYLMSHESKLHQSACISELHVTPKCCCLRSTRVNLQYLISAHIAQECSPISVVDFAPKCSCLRSACCTRVSLSQKFKYCSPISGVHVASKCTYLRSAYCLRVHLSQECMLPQSDSV